MLIAIKLFVHQYYPRFALVLDPKYQWDFEFFPNSDTMAKYSLRFANYDIIIKEYKVLHNCFPSASMLGMSSNEEKQTKKRQKHHRRLLIGLVNVTLQLLCILTSKRVLRMPLSGKNY